ncbi:MAG: hypothetical protein KGZ94_00125 [Clostridia bacterium]|nr:hypothetical protein [Clostridia bacterium]
MLDFIATYLPLLFLLFVYTFIASSLIKRSGVGIKTTDIPARFLKKEFIALLSMLLSLFTWLWIEMLGLMFYNKFGLFGNMMNFWPLFLLLAVSASLSLALKKVIGLLIALPYLLLLGEGFLWTAWSIVYPFRETGTAFRAVIQYTYALVLPINIILLLQKADEAMKNRLYFVALAVQFGLAIGAVYYYTYYYYR